MTRIIGTMAGAGLATLIVALLRPSQTILVALIAVMAWGCYALLRVNYALFSMLITGYIALLFAFGGLPEPAVALHRVIATAIGGSVALAAHFLYVARPPRRGPSVRRRSLALKTIAAIQPRRARSCRAHGRAQGAHGPGAPRRADRSP